MTSPDDLRRTFKQIHPDTRYFDGPEYTEWLESRCIALESKNAEVEGKLAEANNNVLVLNRKLVLTEQASLNAVEAARTLRSELQTLHEDPSSELNRLRSSLATLREEHQGELQKAFEAGQKCVAGWIDESNKCATMAESFAAFLQKKEVP